MLHLALLLACGFQTASDQQSRSWQVVAYDDAGTAEAPHLLEGNPYTIPESVVAGSESERTCARGDSVTFGYGGVDPAERYCVLVIMASDAERLQHLFVDGIPLWEPIPLSANHIGSEKYDLPSECLADGQFILEMRRLKGPNATISRIEIASTSAELLTPLAPGSQVPGQFRIPVPTVEAVDGLLPTYRPIPETTLHSGRPAVSLNGAWRASAEPGDGWLSDPDRSQGWVPVEVPGQFVQQGIDFDPEQPVACRRSFEVDPAWLEGRVILRFESVFSHCRVFVNGAPAGEHLGGFTPFELDVTAEVQAGSNDLALEVTSWSEADLLGSLSQDAAHPLGGILRDVTLFTVPTLHLSDLRIVTDLDEAYEDATLELELELTNCGDEEARDLSLGIVLYGTRLDQEPDLPPVPAHSRRRTRLEFPISTARLWDPEHPFLHILQLYLASEGSELEHYSCRIGFREVEVRGEELLLNGRPLKLRGANRHEVDPLRGRVVDLDTCFRDAELLRAANCNFVRTSHYPPSRHFLEACDRLGLLVEVEAPLGWVGHDANRHWGELDPADPRWLPYQRQANLESVHFHRNHPSVLCWSLADESSWTPNFAQVLAAVSVADPSRPQVFHDQAWGGPDSGGSRAPIANLHHPGPGGPAQVAERSVGRPVLFGEYGHLSVHDRRETLTDPAVRDLWGRSLRPMWEEMYATPGVLGGALGSGIDDVFHLPDGRTVGHGPWGLIDGWRRRKPEFLQVRNCYAPVVVLSSQEAGEGRQRIELENRFSFTNLDEVEIRWWVAEGEGSVDGPDVEPGQRGSIELDAPGTGPLPLAFTDRRGVVVQEVVVDSPELEAPLPLEERGGPLEVEEERETVTVRGAGLELVLDRSTGRIAELSRGGRTLLVGGPHLLAVPLTSGRGAPEHQPALPPWTGVCEGWSLEGLSVGQDSNGVEIVALVDLDLARGSFTLRLDHSGTLCVEYDFELTAESFVPRQVGVVFDLPRELDTLTWARRAEWTDYPADHIGRPYGSSPAFYPDCPEPVPPSTRPTWPWSHDATPLGCNDFRATRSGVFLFGLAAEDGRVVCLVGDGTGDARAWVDGDERIRLLAASLTVPTGEMFVRSHLDAVTPKWTAGERIRGSAELRFP